MAENPTPPDKSRHTTTSWVPKRLTPKMHRAIRLFCSGMSIPKAAKECGYAYDYLRRVLCSPLGQEERKRLGGRIEEEFIDKLTSSDGAGSKEDPIAAEVKASTLEAIQQLRLIMMTSKSDVAKATAAKEIIELGQLKARLKGLSKPVKEQYIDIDNKDQKALTGLIGELRELAVGGTNGATAIVDTLVAQSEPDESDGHDEDVQPPAPNDDPEVPDEN